VDVVQWSLYVSVDVVDWLTTTLSEHTTLNNNTTGDIAATLFDTK